MRGERGEHRLAGLAQNSPHFNNGCNIDNDGFGYYGCTGYWPYLDCPRYDLRNIGQYFGCGYPIKRKVR
jgi:hypothetical protein